MIDLPGVQNASTQRRLCDNRGTFEASTRRHPARIPVGC